MKFPHTTWIQNQPLYRAQSAGSLWHWMFTNKMIRMHDCVTWNAFSNLWNCINILDFCHQYSIPAQCPMHTNTFYYMYINVPEQVQNFEQFFSLKFLFFFRIGMRQEKENQKRTEKTVWWIWSSCVLILISSRMKTILELR